MGYIDETLTDGEQVLFRTTRHPGVLMFPIIALALVVTSLGLGWVGLLCTVLAACWLAAELAARTSEYGVTTRRLLMRTGGMLRRRTLAVPLENVVAIEVRQSALGATLGYGTVVIRENDGRSTAFPTLHHCLAFKERAQDQLAGTKRGK